MSWFYYELLSEGKHLCLPWPWGSREERNVVLLFTADELEAQGSRGKDFWFIWKASQWRSQNLLVTDLESFWPPLFRLEIMQRKEWRMAMRVRVNQLSLCKTEGTVPFLLNLKYMVKKKKKKRFTFGIETNGTKETKTHGDAGSYLLCV